MSYITRWLYSTSHKDIAILYLGYGLISSMVATGMSVIIRMELSGANPQYLQSNNQVYNVMVTGHAIGMIFLFVMPVLIGAFGNYFLPIMIGAGAPNKVLNVSNYIVSSLLYIWGIYYAYRDLTIAYNKPNKILYGVADCKRELTCWPSSISELSRKVNYVEDNELDTHREDYISHQIQDGIRLFEHSKAWIRAAQDPGTQNGMSSLKLKCSKENEQAAKVNETQKPYLAQIGEISASRMKIQSAFGSFVVVSNIRKDMKRLQSISWSNYNTKGTILNTSSLRMFSTKAKEGTFKVTKRSELTAILINELKVLRDLDNKIHNLNSILSDPYFWIAAYNSIKSKKGNMTKGITKETLDGINFAYFERLAKDIVSGKYQPKPIRTVEIPKANGKMRPIGISSPRDKIVQAGLASIVEAIWEPMFVDNSHGFRPKRSTHTALRYLYLVANKYTWVIQGDITKCFDSIPHNVIMDNIRKEIGCPNTISLLYKCIRMKELMLNGTIRTNNIGTPQGSVLSPILCNIVMHNFDLYVLNNIKETFEIGKLRKSNPIYHKLQYNRLVALKNKDFSTAKNILNKMRLVTKGDPLDPHYKRIAYVRYADDFVILVIGSFADCLDIRDKMKVYLKETCGLELNMEKTLITKNTKKWTFLGAIFKKLRRIPHLVKVKNGGRMVANTRILVMAPIMRIIETFVESKILKRDKYGMVKPRGLGHLVPLSHYDIVAFYNSKINSLVSYYSFASNYSRLSNLIWFLRASCGLTLSRKHKLASLSKSFKKWGTVLTDPHTGVGLNIPKTMKVLHKFNTGMDDNKVFTILKAKWTNKLTDTSFGKVCTICGTKSNIEMHHIRTVNDVRGKMLAVGGTSYQKWQGGILRKQIPLCKYHHDLYHNNKLSPSDIAIIRKFR